MRLLAAALLCLSLSGTAQAHDFYAGFSIVSYNADTRNLEVIHRLFTDDLARAVTGDPSAPVDAATEPLVSAYVADAFRIEEAALSWVGMEPVADTTLIYLESPMAEPPTALTVTNRLLFGFFAVQVNTVNIEVGEQFRGMSFAEMLQDPRTKTARFD